VFLYVAAHSQAELYAAGMPVIMNNSNKSLLSSIGAWIYQLQETKLCISNQLPHLVTGTCLL